MNPRVTAAFVGVFTVVLGLAGLVYPARIMGLLGFTVLNASQAAGVLGEVRGVYGGLFVVMGVYTILASMRASVPRARLVFIGLLWLGVCAGRLLGVVIDGNPGLFGWLYAAVELIMGGALVASALLSQSAASSAQGEVASTPVAAS